MTTHFSTMLRRAVCSSSITKDLTGEATRVTCMRCRIIVHEESATGADLWALEAQAERQRHGNLSEAHVQALYVLALLKREAELQRAKEHVEYTADRLAETAQRAVDAGVRR